MYLARRTDLRRLTRRLPARQRRALQTPSLPGDANALHCTAASALDKRIARGDRPYWVETLIAPLEDRPFCARDRIAAVDVDREQEVSARSGRP